MKLKWSSFRAALAGLGFLVRTQIHARWHLLVAFVVTAAGFFFGVSRGEWMALIFSFALVWVAEAVNTAVEQACDAISQDHHDQIRNAKDVAAAAVLLAAVCAVAIGLLVFVPHFMAWMQTVGGQPSA